MYIYMICAYVYVYILYYIPQGSLGIRHAGCPSSTSASEPGAPIKEASVLSNNEAQPLPLKGIDSDPKKTPGNTRNMRTRYVYSCSILSMLVGFPTLGFPC